MAALLAGKAALVTGSTSGIGLAVARALAGAGANVCLHGFGDLSAIQQVQDDLQSTHGVKTSYSDADLKQPAKIREMVKQVPAGGSCCCSNKLYCLVDSRVVMMIFAGVPCRHTGSLDVWTSW